MGSKQTLMDAHVKAQHEVVGVDTLLTTWLTTRNRPWVHDKAQGVYTRTRVPEVPFENEMITDRLVALLARVGVHGITVEHDVDGAALRLTIPDTQPIKAIEQLALAQVQPLRIHEQVARGGR